MFVEENCVIEPTAEVTKTMLYEEYQNWTKESGLKSMSRMRFYRQLGLDYPMIQEDT